MIAVNVNGECDRRICACKKPQILMNDAIVRMRQSSRNAGKGIHRRKMQTFIPDVRPAFGRHIIHTTHTHTHPTRPATTHFLLARQSFEKGMVAILDSLSFEIFGHYYYVSSSFFFSLSTSSWLLRGRFVFGFGYLFTLGFRST